MTPAGQGNHNAYFRERLESTDFNAFEKSKEIDGRRRNKIYLDFSALDADGVSRKMGCCRLQKSRQTSYVFDFNNYFGPDGLRMVDDDPINKLVKQEFQNLPMDWTENYATSEVAVLESKVD